MMLRSKYNGFNTLWLPCCCTAHLRLRPMHPLEKPFPWLVEIDKNGPVPVHNLLHRSPTSSHLTAVSAFCLSLALTMSLLSGSLARKGTWSSPVLLSSSSSGSWVAQSSRQSRWCSRCFSCGRRWGLCFAWDGSSTQGKASWAPSSGSSIGLGRS